MDFGSVAESVKLVQEKAFVDLKDLSFKDVHVSRPQGSLAEQGLSRVGSPSSHRGFILIRTYVSFIEERTRV